MTPAETLRAAGWLGDADGNWRSPQDVGGFTEREALDRVAAERAHEDRALLATLAAGVEASLTGESTLSDEAFGKYVRRRFAALYGRAPEIGAPPADDAAAKVASVEALIADWRNYANAQRRAAEGDGHGRESAAREANTYDAICKSIAAALAGEVTP